MVLLLKHLFWNGTSGRSQRSSVGRNMASRSKRLSQMFEAYVRGAVPESAWALQLPQVVISEYSDPFETLGTSAQTTQDTQYRSSMGNPGVDDSATMPLDVSSQSPALEPVVLFDDRSTGCTAKLTSPSRVESFGKN